jgi:hypothetical protein
MLYLTARMGVIFITAMPTACGNKISLTLPVRQNNSQNGELKRLKWNKRFKVLPFRQLLNLSILPQTALSLICGYENFGFQPTGKTFSSHIN